MGGVIGFRGVVYCWLGAMEVASDPFVDSVATSRTVTFECEGDIVERLDRFGNFFSSEALDLEDLWLARGDVVSLSVFEDLDFTGVSTRDVLPDLVPSSLLDRRLEDERLTSVRILMLVFFALVFSEPFSLSSDSTTGLPFREEGWSRPVKGGLGGAW